MRILSLALVAAFLATVPSEGRAQTARIVGPSVQRFSEGDSRFVTAGVRWSALSRRGTGVDAVMALVPEAVGPLGVTLQLDVGFAQALRVAPATLMLEGGVSNFLVAGSNNVLLPGVQAGIAVILPLQRRCGLRLDAGRHYYFPQEGSFGLGSVGIGLAVLTPHRDF